MTKKKKKKFYVIWEGHETGIALTWEKCEEMVKGYSGARFKSFSTIEEAEKQFYENY